VKKILLEKCAFSRRNNMHNVMNIKSNSCQNRPFPAGKTLELCKLVWQEKKSYWNSHSNAAFD
jgi:hypothetical protein